jgi:hypothetical protein
MAMIFQKMIFQKRAQDRCAAEKRPLVRIGGEGAESRVAARSAEGGAGGARLGTFDGEASTRVRRPG